MSACVDSMIVWSRAGLPGALIYWQLRTRTLNGISSRFGETLVGDDFATGFEKLISASVESLR